jgi:hypothetical protein
VNTKDVVIQIATELVPFDDGDDELGASASFCGNRVIKLILLLIKW